MNRRRDSLLLAMTLIFTGSSCAKFMGALRRDLDDYPPEPVYNAPEQPTVGGRWSEKGTLTDDLATGPGYYEDRNPYPAHSERAPASSGGPGRGPEQQAAWISDEQQEANRRDQYRFTGEDPEQTQPTAGSLANLAPPIKRQYKSGNRATKADFLDDNPADGSLWASDGQTNYYFTKNKVRGPGDIVTLNMEQDLVADMVSESKRTLSQPELDKELAVIQERINAQYLPLIQKAEADLEAKRLAELAEKERKKSDKDAGGADRVVASQAAPNVAAGPAAPRPAEAQAAGAQGGPEGGTAPASVARGETLLANENGAILPPGVKTTKLVVGEKEYIVPRADPNEINLAPLMEVKGGDKMMTEIIERYPNGNYKIRGIKKINYKNGVPRLLQVTGIVKATDIAEDDTTSSGKLYEYRIEGLR